MVNTLELLDALSMSSAEIICAVQGHLSKQHPVVYKQYGPGALFGSGFDCNVASVFGFQTSEDEVTALDINRRIVGAIEALELSGLVILHSPVLVRERIQDRTIKPAEYEVEVSVVV